MSDDKKYNGWSNYETWNVALWIDNEQHTYNLRCVWACDAWDRAKSERAYETQSRTDAALYILAETIKEYIEEHNPLADGCTLYTDLLNAAISDVNWYEIAENWLEDAKENDELEPAVSKRVLKMKVPAKGKRK